MRRAARAQDEVFRAIAHPTRRAILDRLRAGPIRAGELASGFGESRPAISKHLRVLRETGVVSERRSGRERLYSLNPTALQRPADWLEGYRSFWQASLARLKRRLEEA